MTTYRALTTFALSAAFAVSAFAQAKTSIAFFTPANVTKALTEMGIKDVTAIKRQGSDGQSVDVISFSNSGLKHIGILTVCSAKGCLGLQLMTIWGDNAGKTASRIAINAYNADFGFGKGFVGPNNTLVYSRYTISDGGVSVDNLKANVSNFAGGAQHFMQMIAKAASGSEASLKPSTADGMMHSVARIVPPEADAVLMELSTSQGLNVLSLQSAPVPDAPALIKPAQ